MRSLFRFKGLNGLDILKQITVNMVFNYKKNRVWFEDFSVIMQLGLTMAGCILFCLMIGWYLDKWLGTKGIFITIFIILGVIGGGNTVYRQILEITDPKKKKKKNPDNGTN